MKNPGSSELYDLRTNSTNVKLIVYASKVYYTQYIILTLRSTDIYFHIILYNYRIYYNNRM